AEVAGLGERGPGAFASQGPGHHPLHELRRNRNGLSADLGIDFGQSRGQAAGSGCSASDLDATDKRGPAMSRASRRTTLKLLGGAGLAATLPLPLAAQGDDLVVPNTYQNFKRGTIHSLHPERRIFNIVWEDLGRVKMRAADLVTNYPQLKVGNIVDTQWYDYLDFMIPPKSAAGARPLLPRGPRLQGIPGMQEPIRLWRMDGMVTKVDGNTIYLINASGGRPEEPAPERGGVVSPQAVHDTG